MSPAIKAWIKDTAERVLWTAVQGALSIPILDSFGWVELGDGQVWKAMAAGGVAAVLSLIKSVAANRLAEGDTAQLGAKTYSYTEAGPGAAGPEV